MNDVGVPSMYSAILVAGRTSARDLCPAVGKQQIHRGWFDELSGSRYLHLTARRLISLDYCPVIERIMPTQFSFRPLGREVSNLSYCYLLSDDGKRRLISTYEFHNMFVAEVGGEDLSVEEFENHLS